jgi:hypothetical protein
MINNKNNFSCSQIGPQLMVFVFFVLTSCTSHAAIYQCNAPDGSKIFTDQPCQIGIKGATLPKQATSSATTLEQYKKTAEKLRLEHKAEEDAYLAGFDAAVGPQCVKLFRALPPMNTIYYERDNSASKAEFIKLGCPAKVGAVQNAYAIKSEATKLRHAALLENARPDSTSSEAGYDILKKKMAALEREHEVLSQASMNRSGEKPQCRQLENRLVQARKENKASADTSAAQAEYEQLDCVAKAEAIWMERQNKVKANYEARVAVHKEMRVVGQARAARTAQTPQCKKLADQMATIFLAGAKSDSQVRASLEASSLMDQQKCDPNLLEQAITIQMAAFTTKIDSVTKNPCEAKRALQNDLKRLQASATVQNNQQEMAQLEARISTLGRRCS